ncbi:MAG: TetR/AcrR family transcriptional regulator [Acidimicrobiales bacterium]
MRPKTDRRSRQGEASRRRIIEATLELAQERGYTATSIAKVSERSGLPASSVYWHFESKDALFAAVIDDSFDRWRRSMPGWEPLGDGQDRREVVAERIDRAVASIASNPHFWRLGLMLALEHHPVEPTARQRFIDIRTRVIDNMDRFWNGVITGGGAPDARSRRLARFTMAVADGLFVAAQVEGPADLGELGDILTEVLCQAAGRAAGDDDGGAAGTTPTAGP